MSTSTDAALSPEQRAWLTKVAATLGATASDNSSAGVPVNFDQYTNQADSKAKDNGSFHAHPHLFNEDDIPHRPEDAENQKKLNAPPAGDWQVTVNDRDGGSTIKMPHSSVVKHKKYVDNEIQKLTAQPSLMKLEVKSFDLIYTNGGKFTVLWVALNFKRGTEQAKTLELKGGFIYPIDGHGKAYFDEANTPNIIICANWISDELKRRKQQRVHDAEIIATFASIVGKNSGLDSVGISLGIGGSK